MIETLNELEIGQAIADYMQKTRNTPAGTKFAVKLSAYLPPRALCGVVAATVKYDKDGK